MEKRFEMYINTILNNLECYESEKEEIAVEMHDHLVMLKNEYRKKGYSENQAINEAISAFGKEEKIQRGMRKSMFPYINFVKWGGGIVCFLLAILLMEEGITLLRTVGNVDGTGIGISFLLFEINDQVAAKSIPYYSIGFITASVITALVPFFLFNKKILSYITSVW